VACSSTKAAISLKRVKIDEKLLLVSPYFADVGKNYDNAF